MTLLRIDAKGARAVDACGRDPKGAIKRALEGLPEGRPIVIMVHGFKYCPDVTGRDPHRHILALHPRCSNSRTISWPAHLGFRRKDAGLAIAFGWDSSGSIWKAARGAWDAGTALAALVAMIRHNHKYPVNLIAHSLGARVVLCAIAQMPMGAVSTVILLAGAAFQGEALRALRSPAGRVATFLNVSSRENLVFDLLLSGALMGALPGSASIGRGLRCLHPNWCDLRIDRCATRARLAELGFRIAPPVALICHWSAYLRPGMFPLYKAIIAGRVDVSALKVRSGSKPSRLRWKNLLSPG